MLSRFFKGRPMIPCPDSGNSSHCSWEEFECPQDNLAAQLVHQPHNTANQLKGLLLASNDPSDNCFISNHCSLLRMLDSRQDAIKFNDSFNMPNLTPLWTFLRSLSKFCHILLRYLSFVVLVPDCTFTCLTKGSSTGTFIKSGNSSLTFSILYIYIYIYIYESSE